MRELYAIPSEHLILAGLKVDNNYLYPAYNTRGEVRVNTLGSTIVEQQYLSYFHTLTKKMIICGGIEKILYILVEYIKIRELKKLLLRGCRLMRL